MRVAVCPSDRQAVGYYRLGSPAMTLTEQGEDVNFQFLPGLPLNVSKLTGQPVGLADDFDADVLILQRPMADWQLLGMRSAQQRGIAAVIELDDDFRAVDKRSNAGQQITAQHLRTLGECCKHADMITVSTPALAERYAPHGRFAVLPNFIDDAWLDINHTTEHGVIGWTGVLATHRDDLRATHGGVGMALAETPGTFRAWGQGNKDAIVNGQSVEGYGRDLIQRTLHLPKPPDIHPYQSRENYPHEIARLDIGIAPLADTAFNRAKSWLKPLEYAACGVPSIISPTVEYTRLHQQHGIGILAGWRSREWKRETLRLLNDPSYRNQLSLQGRQAVREHLTIQQNAWRWLEVWQSARRTVNA